MKTRKQVRVEGVVQGVAFRHYTSRRAEELGVTGWVRNLPDGSVEALFEGDEHAVSAMVDWCRSGPPAARVSRIRVADGSWSGEFATFSIAF